MAIKQTMEIHMKWGILAALGLASIGTAHAMPAAALDAACRSKAGLSQCETYIAGLLDGFIVQSNLTPGPHLICLSHTVGPTEARDIVMEYFQQHRDKLVDPANTARMGAIHAFQNAFPCSANDSGSDQDGHTADRSDADLLSAMFD
jgi:Rap1a immunity proteins